MVSDRNYWNSATLHEVVALIILKFLSGIVVHFYVTGSTKCVGITGYSNDRRRGPSPGFKV